MAEDKPHVYTDAEVAAKLAELGLTAWKLEDGWLRRKFNTGGWPITLMLVNAIGYLGRASLAPPGPGRHLGQALGQAETHSAGGITDKDFELAQRIETIALWKPAADAALEGNPGKFVLGG